MRRYICLVLALVGVLSLGVSAAEVSCDQVYCFSPADFGQ